MNTYLVVFKDITSNVKKEVLIEGEETLLDTLEWLTTNTTSVYKVNVSLIKE